jgi:hypothetical protein
MRWSVRLISTGTIGGKVDAIAMDIAGQSVGRSVGRLVPRSLRCHAITTGRFLRRMMMMMRGFGLLLVWWPVMVVRTRGWVGAW